MKAGTIAACFVSVALAAVAEPSPKAQPESVAIGSRLELFVDGNLIESLKGVRLKLHPPRPAERVLFFNREWEGGNSGYVTVFQDGGRYRMYYRGASSTGYAVPSLSTEGETAVPEHPQVACTAESPDGITWSRPSLGLFEFNGSKDNNIVWTGSGGHNFSPFKDTNPDATPEQRYKAVGSGRVDEKPVLLGYVSPDGIRWKRLREEPILSDGKFDSLNVAFWDSVRSRTPLFTGTSGTACGPSSTPPHQTSWIGLPGSGPTSGIPLRNTSTPMGPSPTFAPRTSSWRCPGAFSPGVDFIRTPRWRARPTGSS